MRASPIEYGLIAALIAVAALTAMQGLGATLNQPNSTTNVSHDRFGPCIADPAN
jgi:hypothetical protein